MFIHLNGQKKELSDIQSLRDLIVNYCKNPQHVIAEVNGHIIKKQAWEKTDLSENDAIELVTFVGGG